ncbi:antitoxin VbhA family protein [Microbacterium sp. NPDC090281]|uniref:antitoxin VbhA family protein n=1 Tax=Microbacterium sp. NPDC090281 TaxID=3364208 RepID=UPI003801C8FA
MGKDDGVRTREERLDGVLEALHSCRLDGLVPTRNAVHDAWDYVEGRRTLEELIDDVVRRHTRGPVEIP